jgi:hypothetical protein
VREIRSRDAVRTTRVSRFPFDEKYGSTIAEMQIDRAAVSTMNGDIVISDELTQRDLRTFGCRML